VYRGLSEVWNEGTLEFIEIPAEVGQERGKRVGLLWETLAIRSGWRKTDLDRRLGWVLFRT